MYIYIYILYMFSIYMIHNTYTIIYTLYYIQYIYIYVHYSFHSCTISLLGSSHQPQQAELGTQRFQRFQQPPFSPAEIVVTSILSEVGMGQPPSTA